MSQEDRDERIKRTTARLLAGLPELIARAERQEAAKEQLAKAEKILRKRRRKVSKA